MAEWCREHLDLFLPWLAANRPALGLGPTTAPTGSVNANLFVVEHYLFLANEWEIDVS